MQIGIIKGVLEEFKLFFKNFKKFGVFIEIRKFKKLEKRLKKAAERFYEIRGNLRKFSEN